MAISRATHRIAGTGLAIVLSLAAAAHAPAADPLALTANPNPALIGQTITFTFSPKVMSSGDYVNFDFGDGKQGSVAFTTYCALFGGCGTTTHAYTRLGSFAVLALGNIGGQSVSASVTISITAGNDMYVLAAAHVTGANQTLWRTDVEVFNAGAGAATFDIALLARGADNSNPAVTTFTVPTATSMRYEDILSTTFHYTGSAALRIIPRSGSILVTSRTYNVGPGGTYGQSVPALPLVSSFAKNTTAYLIQLSHDPSLKAGFRTNIGLVNPTPASEDVSLDFFASDGTHLGTVPFTLKPYGYEQLDRAFELVTADQVSDGYVTIVNSGDGLFFTYASVVDNLTGDPTLIPALTP